MGDRLTDAQLEHVRQLLLQYYAAIEDLWIEREAFKSLLKEVPNFDGDLDKIAAAYKADPDWRERARATYASLRNSLENASKSIIIEDLSQETPPDEIN